MDFLDLYRPQYGDVQRAKGKRLGIKPLKFIQGDHKNLLKQMEELPAPSQAEASRAAHDAAYLTEAANNLAEIVKARQEQIKAATKMYDLAAKHQGSVMEASKAMAEIEKDFRIKYTEHGAAVEKKQAELDGYLAAMEGKRAQLYGA